MAGTINYLYDPNQAVYVIDDCEEGPAYVSGGTVLRVRAEVVSPPTTNNVVYDVRLDGNKGTKEFKEADVFPDKATAIAEYQNRVQ